MEIYLSLVKTEKLDIQQLPLLESKWNSSNGEK